MLHGKKMVGWLLAGLFFLFIPMLAQAEEGNCFCATDLNTVTQGEIDKIVVGACVVVGSQEECLRSSGDTKLFKGKCEFFSGFGNNDGGQLACKDRLTKWLADKKELTAAANDFDTKFQGITSRLIPECLLQDTLSDNCRDVSIFVYFLIQLARFLFGIIGALALLMFVYGGFTLILSQGNSEKIKKGTQIIIAAVIGLVIMFGAYMLVSFLGEAVNINSSFKLK